MVGCALTPSAAHAQAAAEPDPSADPFFGVDKVLHFSAGFGLAAVGYGIGVAALDDRWAGVALGGGLGVGLTGLKEGLDAGGLGTPSWKDFVWGLAGTALGLGVSVTFDAALRGP